MDESCVTSMILFLKNFWPLEGRQKVDSVNLLKQRFFTDKFIGSYLKFTSWVVVFPKTFLRL